MTALHQFGAEMLKLSRGLESVASSSTASPTKSEYSSSNHLQYSYGSPRHTAQNLQYHQQQAQAAGQQKVMCKTGLEKNGKKLLRRSSSLNFYQLNTER